MRKKIFAAVLTVLLTGCSPPTADVMESLTISDTAQAYDGGNGRNDRNSGNIGKGNSRRNI